MNISYQIIGSIAKIVILISTIILPITHNFQLLLDIIGTWKKELIYSNCMTLHSFELWEISPFNLTR